MSAGVLENMMSINKHITRMLRCLVLTQVSLKNPEMYIGLAYLAEKLWFVNGREGDFMHGSVRQ
jgi:hypothetical protein